MDPTDPRRAGGRGYGSYHAQNMGKQTGRASADFHLQSRSSTPQSINLDYILELIFEKNKKVKSKVDLIEDARRIIRGSFGNRAKESLIVDFINQTDLDKIDDKAGVIDAFFSFAQAAQRKEVEELIRSEDLNSDAARRYISASIKREFASENGADLNAILPKMSPLNPQFRTKKTSVFEKIATFVEKFKGVGGQV